MGYGLGAAIGAQIANPDKQVINIAGDGCFRMNMNEIATAVRNDLPLIEIVINNHALGMVRQWQNLFYEKRFSHTVLNDRTDYVKLAEAMGATGYRAASKDEFRECLKKALESKNTVLIECVIDSDDMVYPMVAPGKSIEEVFDAEDIKNNADLLLLFESVQPSPFLYQPLLPVFTPITSTLGHSNLGHAAN